MGMGQFINTFTPITPPSIPFGGLYPFTNTQMGMGQFINTFTPNTPPPIPFGGLYPFTNTQKKESAEDVEEIRKKQEAEKKAEELKKRLEMIKQNSEKVPEIQAQIKEIEDGKKQLNNLINKAEKGKEKEDGTITVKETWKDYNKLPWWKKGLRGASHLVQGTWKLATGFFGYETNPKTGESEWNWKKGLKNAAIAAGCIALTAIPVVGPVISTGLLATGVVCGTIGTVKGVKNALNAKTPEELDHAYQDLGAGLTIGMSSALGLRGLGKGMQASASASGSSAAIRSTSSNAVSQFVKDMTINACKATVQGVKSDNSAIALNGFWKTYGSNLKGLVPKLGASKFEEARNNTTQQINARLNEISNELNNPSINPVTKTLLEQEQTMLNAQKTELVNTVTKDGWAGLKTNSKSHNNAKAIKDAMNDMQTTGSADLNGTVYNMSKDNINALQEALKRSEKISKEIAKLSKARSSTIKKMAFMKKYASDVEAYTGKTRNTRIGRVYDTIKITKSDITWKNAILSPLKMLWEATMIPFKPWNYVQKSPTSTFYKIEETFVPQYEEGFLTSGFIGEALDMGDKTMTTKVYSKDENGKDVEEVVPVTKETLAQMKEQLKQYDEALAKAQSELSQIYVA